MTCSVLGWILLWLGCGFATTTLLLLSGVMMNYGCNEKINKCLLGDSPEEAIFGFLFISIVSWPLAVLVVPIFLIAGLCMVISRLLYNLIVRCK